MHLCEGWAMKVGINHDVIRQIVVNNVSFVDKEKKLIVVELNNVIIHEG